jgi:hypothetical protein
MLADTWLYAKRDCDIDAERRHGAPEMQEYS